MKQFQQSAKIHFVTFGRYLLLKQFWTMREKSWLADYIWVKFSPLFIPGCLFKHVLMQPNLSSELEMISKDFTTTNCIFSKL